MKYICFDIKEKYITAILEYEPNVPNGIKLIEISDEDAIKLSNGDICFDYDSMKLISKVDEEKQKILQEKLEIEQEIKNLQSLNSTDWKVFRHIREQALGIVTSLTTEEYIALETERNTLAKNINKELLNKVLMEKPNEQNL